MWRKQTRRQPSLCLALPCLGMLVPGHLPTYFAHSVVFCPSSLPPPLALPVRRGVRHRERLLGVLWKPEFRAGGQGPRPAQRSHLRRRRGDLPPPAVQRRSLPDPTPQRPEHRRRRRGGPSARQAQVAGPCRPSQLPLQVLRRRLA